MLIVLTLFMVLSSCASGPIGLRNAKEIKNVSGLSTGQAISYDNAEKILEKYVINFIIPNPLYGDFGSESNKNDPSHESAIHCRAVFLDDFSTEADILVQCKTDSLEKINCEELREKYIEKNIRDGMFRIRIEMESGFSDKSMDPELWAIYLKNSDGVMIEPFDITNSSIASVEDSVYSEYYEKNFYRHILKHEITLYFKKITFFGENLLSNNNPFIILEMSREKKIIAGVAWKNY